MQEIGYAFSWFFVNTGLISEFTMNLVINERLGALFVRIKKFKVTACQFFCIGIKIDLYNSKIKMNTCFREDGNL
ncbi:hypothetical protein [Pseudotamlana carrageenivorans]|uniref:Uncharacterized protein n=1 Tax=Pseudotamlana carrageenivorans TaxID=2069432 RepID=A0A2I7SM83_9FLAO|nr:hypothetical protein [Tamlana carrageenivorans]AUS07023.1 hypothetical protein C1A40_16925 [Tamlana carrageenivorans]